MAETLISPGVLARENDQSQITSQPVQAGAAIVGPTVKGQVEIPTLVTTYSEYLANFGSTFESGSDTYSFLTSISAYNYFQNGGTSLIVTRVASGSFTSATTTKVAGDTGLKTSTFVTNSFNVPTGSYPLKSTNVLTGGTSGLNGIGDFIFSNATTLTSLTITTPGTGYTVGETITLTTSSLGANTGGGTDMVITLGAANIIESNNVFTLETIGEGVNMNSTSTESSTGALASGSADNIRWEIVSPNTARGVFTVVIRQGNDVTKSKSVLESFTNVSLDPNSSNYIARIIGDQKQVKRGSGVDTYLQTSGSFRNASRYVRVKSVDVKTPNYFDNSGVAKTKFVGSIPVAQSGTMGGGVGEIVGSTSKYYEAINNSNTQGLAATDYTDALGLLANKDEFQYNIITTPGLMYSQASHKTPLNTLVSNIENRGDAIIIMDLEAYGSTVAATVTTADSLDTSYAASYWPWTQITDPDSGRLVWVPASTLMPGVYASNDATSEAWFAPAGINRGGLGNVVQAERKLTQSNRDDLYVGKVNPIATFPGRGVVVFGQKTLQTQASALDRVNVRRLLIELKSYISQVSDNLVFEQNSAATRNLFLSQVNPYLESVQQRQGLYAFKVTMDGSNNTADVIDRNQLIGAIYIQPTKTAEFIYLDFNILPTGATFPA